MGVKVTVGRLKWSNALVIFKMTKIPAYQVLFFPSQTSLERTDRRNQTPATPQPPPPPSHTHTTCPTLPVPKRVAASYSWRGSGKNTKHPDVKQVSVIGKVGSDRWKSMPNAPFVANFEKLKVEYTEKMDSYHKKLSVLLYYHIEKLKWRSCKRGKHDAEPKKRRRTKKAPSVDALNQLGCIKIRLEMPPVRWRVQKVILMKLVENIKKVVVDVLEFVDSLLDKK